MNAVELESVTKVFAGREAVHELSLTVPAGSVCGFLGPNGAGKTTTLRMIMGILWPDAGRIRVLGDLSPDAARPRLAYLPEEKGLYKRMRVLELLVYLGRLRNLSAAEAERRARTWLQRFDLLAVAEARCETLSKGMGQKVQIAGALLHDPELVILDEPFSGLDPVNVELVRRIVLELRAAGRTVILSTHVMEQAEQICDHVLLLDRGRTLLAGPISSVRAAADRTLAIDYEGDGSVLAELPGVTRLNDAGVHAELSLAADTDPDALLALLVGRIRIRRFELMEPSLHEVFVRNVGRATGHDNGADAADASAPGRDAA
ncbi:MAG TPA: ATP-binding cassette domain-containing protein [Pseudomonadales bacterium]|nr:ATP-binding cassette domain-containing protein [Pseudomonadales bacterium]